MSVSLLRLIVSLSGLSVSLMAMAANATTVLIHLDDFQQGTGLRFQGALTNRTVYVTPDDSRVAGGGIITRDRFNGRTDTQGALYLSNVVVGSYRVEVLGPYTNTLFRFAISTNCDCLINVTNLLVSGPATNVPSATLGWSQAAADSRYQRSSDKGQTNGYAGLGADGKVPASQLPAGNGGAANTLLNGEGAPTGEDGSDGDFWLDILSWEIYGPKADGVWGSAVGLVGPTGPQGAEGAMGPAGSSGTNGANGTNATVSVGTVTTGAAGSNAGVTNSGTALAAVLDFTIPRGATGAAGVQGPEGPQGIQGEQGLPGSPGADGAPGTNMTLYATNYAYASGLTLPMDRPVIAGVSNACTGDLAVTVSPVVVGTWARLEVEADGSARTVSFLWPAGCSAIYGTTNGTLNLTNLYLPAGKVGWAWLTCSKTNRVSVMTAVQP